ncbi:leucine-rich repeat-containing G-protein coupled receptor 4-like [Tribolium madens]|uniref:leucine-rich repeat-containing G-protein coupled receptor 4-like n=1 Tax=Tribolium madens TaxID=41895 RepID=UPI001CF76535|nr:leucine-rich repeat-containing G-protein coupled receptor 4-like [Tribolium madens]
MFASFYAKLGFIILVSLLQEFNCECRQSYVTICDSLEDIEKLIDKENFMDLVVGNETRRANPLKTYNLHSIIPFNKLISLTIIGQLERISPLFGRCQFDYQLQVLNFYNNDIKKLEKGSFPGLNLKKVSLVNNDIEILEPGMLSTTSKIEIMDLSDNKIEVIEDSVFRYRHRGPVVTKTIILRNNRISYIQAKSLPETLKILYLDGNKLREIQDDVMQPLSELRELSLSRNQLYKVPNLSNATKLEFLNLSYNNIETVDNSTFQNLSTIGLIDLSNNKIRELSFLPFSYLIKRYRPFVLSLGFNQLVSFDFDNITKTYENYKVELFLYGNPFECREFDKIQLAMKNLKIKQNQCDVKFHSEGKTPYCLNYHSIFSLYVPDVQKEFLKLIQNNRKLISCHLYPVNYFSNLGVACVA